ncbi:MAG: D-aminoacyl-tRNA deacylase [Dehalococcoidia bacterium]
MRALIQRVTRASVIVEGKVVATIDRGLVVLVGVGEGDTNDTAVQLAKKVSALRMFEDEGGKMNLSCADAGGAVLCISQFTLYGDVRRGNRPSFSGAATPELAGPLYAAFCSAVEAEGLRCQRGVFGAEMAVELVNDGPVTLLLDTADLGLPRKG